MDEQEELTDYEKRMARVWERAEQQRIAYETVHCSRCGRLLKDAESIRLGLGSECRRKSKA